jgi:hypothetical protein
VPGFLLWRDELPLIRDVAVAYPRAVGRKTRRVQDMTYVLEVFAPVLSRVVEVVAPGYCGYELLNRSESWALVKPTERLKTGALSFEILSISSAHRVYRPSDRGAVRRSWAIRRFSRARSEAPLLKPLATQRESSRVVAR